MALTLTCRMAIINLLSTMPVRWFISTWPIFCYYTLMQAHQAIQLKRIQALMWTHKIWWADLLSIGLQRKMLATIDLLVQSGALLLKSTGGEDPLFWACRAGNLAVVNLLQTSPLGPSLNVYQKNERGLSAFDVAKTQDIKDLLQAHALSCGFTDSESKRVQNITEAVSVKVGVPNASSSSSPDKSKKLTIKLKPKEPPKQ